MSKRKTTRSAAVGATLYEFKMQVRRKALWITFGLFGLALVLSRIALSPWSPQSEGLPLPHLLANWSLAVQFVHPVAFGVLLADRVPRDGRTRVQELLETLPAPPVGHFLGKYLGATLATLVPLLLTWLCGLAYIVADHGAPEAVPLGLAAFLTVNLPGLLFVAAFSVACPVILWVPLYQFLFVGYWFWGNLIPTGPSGYVMPTLSGTYLTPLGQFMAKGFFGTEQATPRATVAEGVASLGLLLGIGGMALVCGYALWRRRTAA